MSPTPSLNDLSFKEHYLKYSKDQKEEISEKSKADFNKFQIKNFIKACFFLE
jgi:hypothetical protein